MSNFLMKLQSSVPEKKKKEIIASPWTIGHAPQSGNRGSSSGR
jgi:hypothetical protein